MIYGDSYTTITSQISRLQYVPPIIVSSFNIVPISLYFSMVRPLVYFPCNSKRKMENLVLQFQSITTLLQYEAHWSESLSTDIEKSCLFPLINIECHCKYYSTVLSMWRRWKTTECQIAAFFQLWQLITIHHVTNIPT